MKQSESNKSKLIECRTEEVCKTTKKYSKWRFYDTIQCIYILDGELAFKTLTKTSWIKKDEYLFIAPNTLYDILSVPETTTIRVIEINPDIYKGFGNNSLYTEGAEKLLTRSDLQYFKTNKTSLVGKKFSSWFINAFNLSSLDDNYVIESSLSSIELLKVLGEIVKGKTYKVSKLALAERNLTTMIAFMENNLDKQITVSEIGASADIKERQCLRIFQEYLHVSPMQYLMSRRLEEAADLLSGAKIMTVAEIAKKCGFVSSSYFIKLFKRAYGTTPSQYAHGSAAPKKLDNPLEALSDFFS